MLAATCAWRGAAGHADNVLDGRSYDKSEGGSNWPSSQGGMLPLSLRSTRRMPCTLCEVPPSQPYPTVRRLPAPPAEFRWSSAIHPGCLHSRPSPAATPMQTCTATRVLGQPAVARRPGARQVISERSYREARSAASCPKPLPLPLPPPPLFLAARAHAPQQCCRACCRAALPLQRNPRRHRQVRELESVACCTVAITP